jgi:hypothetical protein
MALNTAWPLLANTKPADPGAEICSASGVNHAGDGAPLIPHKGLHASHCTLCPFGAERGPAIPVAVVPFLLPVSSPAQPLARGDAPRLYLTLYPAAPPRAPPVPS